MIINTVSANITKENGHDGVQLWANGPRWATMNYGATTVTGYGEYVYYGNQNFDVDISGTNDDVATSWGGTWQTPTHDQFEDLLHNTTQTWVTSYNGENVCGWVFKGNTAGYTDEEIFLPAAGEIIDSKKQGEDTYCAYWSGTLDGSGLPYRVYLTSGEERNHIGVNPTGVLHTIRPVCCPSYDISTATVTGLTNGASYSIPAGEESYKPVFSLALTTTTNDVASTVDLVAGTDYKVTYTNTADSTTATAPLPAGTYTVSFVAISPNIGQQQMTITVNAMQHTGTANGHVYVQLWKNGPCWAAQNVGAESITAGGKYYRWGNTETFNANISASPGTDDIAGDTSLDVATTWGDSWKMPTKTQMEELWNNTTHTWVTSYNGEEVCGYILTGKTEGFTNEQIFMPAAGQKNAEGTIQYENTGGGYFTSTPYDKDNAYRLWFSQSENQVYQNDKNYGYSIRPLRDPLYDISGATVTGIAEGGEYIIPASEAQYRPYIEVTSAEGKLLTEGIDYTITYSKSDSIVKSLPKGTYKAVIAGSAGGELTYNFTVLPKTEHCGKTGNDYAYVQLWKNGPRWSTKNYGANVCYEEGSYYMWGKKETYVKGEATCEADSEICGNTDFDVATSWASSDASWRMPSNSEFLQLLTMTTSEWVTSYCGQKVCGRVFRGTGDYATAELFLPAGGEYNDSSDDLFQYGVSGAYYTGSTETGNKTTAIRLYFTATDEGDLRSEKRSYGYNIRPICEKLYDIADAAITGIEKDSTYLIPAGETGYTPYIEVTLGTDTLVRKTDYKVIYKLSGQECQLPLAEGEYIAEFTGSDPAAVKTREISFKVKAMTDHVYKDANNHYYVQLWKDGPCWATTNVGAESITDYGNRYKWGCTTAYSDQYSYSDSEIDISGISNYDVATTTWGDGCRMPNIDEFNELLGVNNTKVAFKWVTNYNGKKVNGYLFRGNTDGYQDVEFFMPAAGEMTKEGKENNVGSLGAYWTSTPNSAGEAYRAVFSSETNNTASTEKSYGYSVRPIRDRIFDVDSATVLSPTMNEAYTIPAGETGYKPYVSVTAADGTVLTRGADYSVTYLDKDNNVVNEPLAAGNYTLVIKGSAGSTKKVTFDVNTIPDHVGTENGVTYVQLWKDGPRWAAKNVGAASVTDTGNYYKWGNVNAYSTSTTTYTDSKDISGNTTYDVATTLGGTWKMPTKTEFEALLANTSQTWVTNYNGEEVCGYVFKGLEEGYKDVELFMPANGQYDLNGDLDDLNASGNYYAGTVVDAEKAYRFWFTNGNHNVAEQYKNYGFAVRPVCDNIYDITNATVTGTGSSDDFYIPAGETGYKPYIVVTTSYNEVLTRDKDYFVTYTNEKGDTISEPLPDGTYTITIKGSDRGTKTLTNVHVHQQEHVSTAEGQYYVQLWTNGPRWAARNLGANSVTDNGAYYKWGATEPYPAATSATSKQEVISGTIFDAATKWNTTDAGSWHMPTQAEFQDLLDHTTRTWVTNYNGEEVCGYVFKSTDTNYGDAELFLPANGQYNENGDIEGVNTYGNYFTGTPAGSEGAYRYFFSSSEANLTGQYSDYAFAIRPVCDEVYNAQTFTVSGLESASTNYGFIIPAGEKAYNPYIVVKAGDKTLTEGDYTINYYLKNDDDTYASESTALPLGAGKYKAVITGSDPTCTEKTKEIEFKVSVCGHTGTTDGYTWVQMYADGPKLAVKNVGASSVTDFGDYYKWGATEVYSQAGTYSSSTDDISGTEQDIATVKWGDKWQMPTKTQLENILAHCKSTWVTSYNGKVVNGWILRGTDAYEDAEVFLPAAGNYKPDGTLEDPDHGCYYTGTVDSTDTSPAIRMYFNSEGGNITYAEKNFGYSIRPVVKESDTTSGE